MRTYIILALDTVVLALCFLATLCLLLMSVRCVNMCDVLKPAKAAAVELLNKTDSSFSGNG